MNQTYGLGVIHSQFFNEDQLTATSSGIPNTPSADEEANLQLLANLLDHLKTVVGDFHIESGFRSQAVQQWLMTGGAGSDSMIQASPTSYHMQGKAADITPTDMDVKDFYARLISDPTLRNMMGEIALKKNTIHLSIPTATKQGVPMIVNPKGQYIRYTVEAALKAIGRENYLGSDASSSGKDADSAAPTSDEGTVAYDFSPLSDTDAPIQPSVMPYVFMAGLTIALLLVVYGSTRQQSRIA